MVEGSALNELIAIMAQETELYEELLELAGQKRDVLIEHRLKELKQIVHQESELLIRLVKLDFQRTPVFTALLSAQEQESSHELSVLLPKLELDERDELSRAKERLQAIIREISTRNAINQKLIETQLQYTSFCIGLMTGNYECADSGGYSGSINHPRPLSFSLLDQKV